VSLRKQWDIRVKYPAQDIDPTFEELKRKNFHNPGVDICLIQAKDSKFLEMMLYQLFSVFIFWKRIQDHNCCRQRGGVDLILSLFRDLTRTIPSLLFVNRVNGLNLIGSIVD
jgi:hypothetical protein